MAGLVPQEVFDAYNAVVDSMINYDFGSPCTLLYPTKRDSCGNCVYDTINNKSSNIYNGSGPIPFSMGICPFCDGLGFKESQATDIINLRFYFSKRHWMKVGPMLSIPDGAVQCIGFVTDLPKILAAEQMIVNNELQGYGTLLYKLYGEPFVVGFQNNRYLASYWTRE